MGKSDKIEFKGHSGDMLAARLDWPAGPARAFALFAHCFTCSKDIFAATRIAEGLTAHGIAVLRFDFTGLGASEGEFANTNFSSNVADLLAAAAYLREHHQAPKLLIGHSLGGTAILTAAAHLEEAVAVVSIGAPADAAHVTKNFSAKTWEIEKTGVATVSLAGRDFTIKKQFLDDVAGHSLLDRVGILRQALLICHAPRDEVVGIENAGEIFGAARHPKSFLSLDDADHLLRKKSDAIYVADVIAAWSSRYLGDAHAESRTDLGEGEILVEEAGKGKFIQRVVAGEHRLTADEPKSVGGDDRGPGPYDFLLAGLGACTSMTMRMYAERKGLPATQFSVRLKHQRMHAADCKDCETKDGQISEITRTISISGDLDDAQRAKLMEIADKCPVHRTLTGEIKIRTSLVAQG